MDPIFIMRNRDTREVISKLIQKVCHNDSQFIVTDILILIEATTDNILAVVLLKL